ncbi:FabD/lysophospholipase-like protein [Hyaloscypha variabilis]
MRFQTSATLVATALISRGLATYAPVSTSCPSTSLIRIADGLSDGEQTYRTARKEKADVALADWLLKTSCGFDTSGDLPTVALTSSGGGFRALLGGAGVVQAFDGRDSNVSTSGLYQGITYHSALSGGSWLLSSIIANDFATISSLLEIWKPNFANGLFTPDGSNATAVFADISADIALKKAAGFKGTVADAWSRLLSLQLLPGPNYGVDNTLSTITSLSSFIDYEMPYPIITAQNVDLNGTLCTPPANGSVWEFTPYEFGTWDPEVAAFTPTAFLGTSVSNGIPSTNSCITNYDNLGFVLGTSSTLFNDPTEGATEAPAVLLANLCQATATTSSNSTSTVDPLTVEFEEDVFGLLTEIPAITFTSAADLFATWPNPFYKLTSAPLVSAQQNLAMVDGGETGQVNPIFPFLQPARNVNVILVNDNDGDTAALYPNGAELHNTYLAASAAGLTRMPFVPSSDVFIAQNITERPAFFGCGDSSTATVVWIPNAPLTPAGGAIETAQVVINGTQTESLVANGVAVGSQNDSKEWATCLACGIMEGTGTVLPAECRACLEKYCFTQ